MLEVPAQWIDEEKNKNVLVNLIQDESVLLIVYKTYVNENDYSYSLDFYDNVKEHFKCIV